MRIFDYEEMEELYRQEWKDVPVKSRKKPDRIRVDSPNPCIKCYWEERCRFLLGENFCHRGPCDWFPSRWRPKTEDGDQ